MASSLGLAKEVGLNEIMLSSETLGMKHRQLTWQGVRQDFYGRMECLNFEFRQGESLGIHKGSVNLKPAVCLSIHIISCMERHSVLNVCMVCRVCVCLTVVCKLAARKALFKLALRA